jgi:glutamyl-tRNA reductase
MHVICVGLNHRTAPLELREHHCRNAGELAATLEHFAQASAGRPSGVRELVILSTCNRLEYYAATDGASANGGAGLAAEVRRYLIDGHGGEPTAVQGYLYEYTDRDAAQHLCRVAAGLDSRVLGETQVLGQVAAAYQAALAHGTTGPALSTLFPAAIRLGKRARTETAISRHATSLSALAVRAASQAVPSLTTARTLVIGAGEIAELAVKALRRHGAQDVTVTNRTYARALHLAGRWQVRAVPFAEREAMLAEADLVISATAAVGFVLTRAQVEQARRAQAARPLVLIDLAMPRDIEPQTAQVPGVRCLNLDDLDVERHNGLAARHQAVPQVEALVEAEAERFREWLEGWGTRQLIASLRAKADAIRQAELERTLRHLPQLSAAERKHVEALAEALLNRLLHEPTVRLKSQAGGRRAAEYSAAVRDLFGLDGPA